MRLNLAIKDFSEGSVLRGTERLLRDLVAVGMMQQERRSAAERLESTLGIELTGLLQAALVGKPGPALRPCPQEAA